MSPIAIGGIFWVTKLPFPDAWWDASQMPSQTNGSAVTDVPDETGNGHDLVPGHASVTYVSSALNSLPGVLFKNDALGNPGYLVATVGFSTPTPQAITYYMVGIQSITTAGAALWGGDTLFSPSTQQAQVNGNTNVAGGEVFMNQGGMNSGAGSLASGVGHYITCVWSPTTGASRLRVDGVETTGTNAMNMGNWRIGVLSGADLTLCEARLYSDSEHPTATITAIEAALKTKWGL